MFFCKETKTKRNDMATDTLTDNELIAEFMGLNVSMFGPVLYLSDEDGMIDFKNDAEPYWPDRNWNQLMPVVAKCNELCKETGYPDNLELPQWHIMSVASNVKLVYFSVVEFIKWYNQQTKAV